ncbi:MAG: symmetrical bis(5'-nucleosyl)-tetraphosphatase [Myxococcales bacterium]|nr:symmetrical bis(5'-nucleosyl)-tetraphosphatase [Myxococcales bacterium]HRC54667.1 symmetrical bis(5'-nucleosyl)-tetraphosphatase [Kofleriaceae bacterium]
MARYAVGDLQGCMDSFERLLTNLRFDPEVDELWLVGDLVNRGPRSLDVLRWVRRHAGAVRCVLGNHDLHLLARAAGAPPKRRDTLDTVLAAPDRLELIDWLRTRPLLYVEDPWLLVHAGLHPSWTVATAAQLAAEVEAELAGPRWRDLVTSLEGPPVPWRSELVGMARWRSILSYLVRVRTCFADGHVEPGFDGPPAQAPAGTRPWFALPDARWRTHVPVFGHWAALGLDVAPGHIALDSGCVWGKALSAIRLDDRMVFQVKAAEAAR